jgi:hypothetical protein
MEKIFKPFDLQKAIAGEPICDTIGNRVKFVAYEPTAVEPVICLQGAKIRTYGHRGEYLLGKTALSDLRMAEDVTEALCRLLGDEMFLVHGRAGRVEKQARAIRQVLGL